MVKLKKLFFIKFVVIILSFLMFQGDLLVYAQQEDSKAHLNQAKKDYLSGNYEKMVNRLERVRGLAEDEDKEFLGKTYLLLGAYYEQHGKIIEARKNYKLAKQFLEKPVIEDLDFSNLIEYQRIILGKKIKAKKLVINKKVIEKAGMKTKRKKKFPILLVAAGLAAVTVAVLLLAKKKNSTRNNAQEVYNSIEWIDIPAGEFQMGDNFNEGVSDERPVHTVYLDSYKIARYELTFDQYDKFCDDTGKNKPSDEGWGRGTRPVINVSWNDAKDFCDWLSEKTGRDIHLPTEAQWEKAARGTDQQRYPWGSSSPNCSTVNYAGCGSQTKPVGSHSTGVSPYGVHDMAGNVFEWCSDWYSDTYYSSSPRNNPTGPSIAESRIVRGGAWNSKALGLRSTLRNYRFPSSGGYNNIGFRLVQE